MPRFTRKQTEIVNARQIEESLIVSTPQGQVLAAPGDWIITDESGQL